MSNLVRYINFGIAGSSPEQPSSGKSLYLLPNGDFATIDENGVVKTLDTGFSVHASFAALPVPGLLNRLYLTADTEELFRWTGTTYQSAPGTIDAGTY